jgi:hypothetical protein
MTEASGRPPSASTIRWGLYAPFILLAVVVAGWSAYWFIARTVISGAIDTWLREEKARGVDIACADRSISGYPFRLEIRCSSVSFQRPAGRSETLSGMLGPLTVIGQPHTPSHVIIQPEGPLRLTSSGGAAAELRWESAQASRRASGGELERFSLEMRKPVFSHRHAGNTVNLSAAKLEAHLRRNPTRPAAERAADLFVQVTQLVSSDLDAFLGDPNPSDIDLQLTTSQFPVLAGGATPAALEAWRQAGGKTDLTRLALKKGVKRLEATGWFGIDEQRRLTGRIEPAALNIDQIAGIRLRGGVMDMAAALSGRTAPQGADAPRPLPALDIRDGRLFFGPIRLPGAQLQPLY